MCLDELLARGEIPGSQAPETGGARGGIGRSAQTAIPRFHHQAEMVAEGHELVQRHDNPSGRATSAYGGDQFQANGRIVVKMHNVGFDVGEQAGETGDHRPRPLGEQERVYRLADKQEFPRVSGISPKSALGSPAARRCAAREIKRLDPRSLPQFRKQLMRRDLATPRSLIRVAVGYDEDP
jgi:hypothetical protein